MIDVMKKYILFLFVLCANLSFSQDFKLVGNVKSLKQFSYRVQPENIVSIDGIKAEQYVLNFFAVFENNNLINYTQYESNGSIKSSNDKVYHNGIKVREVTTRYNNGVAYVSFRQQCNENGDAITEALYNTDGSVSGSQAYEYREDGLCIIKYSYKGSNVLKNTTKYEYMNGKDLWKESLYDASTGSLISFTIHTSQESREVCNSLYYAADTNKAATVVKFEYDKRGNMIKRTSISSSFVKTQYLQYDEQNNVIQDSTITSKSGVTTTEIKRYTYVYDNHNNWISKVIWGVDQKKNTEVPTNYIKREILYVE